MGASIGSTCFLAIRGYDCASGDRDKSRVPAATAVTEKGMTGMTYLDRYGNNYTGVVKTCNTPTSENYMKLSVYMHNFAKAPPYLGYVLASTWGEGGGITPPIPEPEQLKCSLTLKRDTLDWGTVPLEELNVNKLVGGNIAVVSCSGGSGTATARLTITDMGRKNNITEMKNDSGDVIPAKLILENEKNTKTFTVRNGYNTTHDVFSRIQSYNISTYGEYKGSAVLMLELP